MVYVHGLIWNFNIKFIWIKKQKFDLLYLISEKLLQECHPPLTDFHWERIGHSLKFKHHPRMLVWWGKEVRQVNNQAWCFTVHWSTSITWLRKCGHTCKHQEQEKVVLLFESALWHMSSIFWSKNFEQIKSYLSMLMSFLLAV